MFILAPIAFLRLAPISKTFSDSSVYVNWVKMNLWNHHNIGPIQTNCFIISKKAKEAVLFDPGGPEAVQLTRKLKATGVEIKHVLVTHGHFDHLGWATDVQKEVEGAKVYLHEAEKECYEEFQDILPQLGYTSVELREPDVWITEGQTIHASGLKFRVLHTPGHSPGSVTYILDGDAYVGDCIFKGSIGRVDLPFANPEDMKKSLLRLMNELSPAIQLYPGHGEFTSMGFELDNNPYLIALKEGRSLF